MAKTMRRGTCVPKHTGKRKGRKKMLTPQEFKDGAQKYFDDCEIKEKSPTVAGLAYALGFSTRQSMHDYAKDPDYKEVINRARLYIESHISELMLSREVFTAGQIFYMKAVYAYDDKQEKEDKTPNITYVMPVPTASSVDSWEQASNKVHDDNLKDGS